MAKEAKKKMSYLSEDDILKNSDINKIKGGDGNGGIPLNGAEIGGRKIVGDKS